MTGSPIAARNELNPIIPIITVLSIFFVLFVVYLFTKVIADYKKSAAYIEHQKQKPTKLSFVNEVAKIAKLLKEERDILWQICRQHPTPNLRYLLRDPESLEPFYKEEFEFLDTADDDKAKSFLFSLRRKIKDNYTAIENMNSSRKISPETELTYTASRGIHYKLKLLEKTQDAMVISIPKAMIDRNDLPKPLEKLQLIFMYKNNNAFQMETRVMRYQTDKTGAQLAFLTHSENIIPLQRRQMERVDIEQQCLFSPVSVKTTGAGKDAKITYTPSEKQYKGVLLDISTGGCRVTTSMPIKSDQFVFIRGKLNARDEDVAIGTIVRTTKRVDGLFILHIRFVKVELAVENRIQALVCKYTQPDLEFLT